MNEHQMTDELRISIARKDRCDHCERVVMWICVLAMVVLIGLKIAGVIE
jgi:hypothetical protein